MTEYVWYDFENNDIIINYIGSDGLSLFGIDILEYSIFLGEL